MNYCVVLINLCPFLYYFLRIFKGAVVVRAILASLTLRTRSFYCSFYIYLSISYAIFLNDDDDNEAAALGHPTPKKFIKMCSKPFEKTSD